MSALAAPRRSSPVPVSATEPVRVSFMIDRLSRAGTESQLLALIREVDRTKVSPSLVLLDGEDDLSRALEPADCPVLRLGVRRLFSLSAARAARQLRAFWGEHRPDVLQVYFLDATSERRWRSCAA
jgi:L-malate glycosyltransferase